MCMIAWNLIGSMTVLLMHLATALTSSISFLAWCLETAEICIFTCLIVLVFVLICETSINVRDAFITGMLKQQKTKLTAVRLLNDCAADPELAA